MYKTVPIKVMMMKQKMTFTISVTNPEVTLTFLVSEKGLISGSKLFSLSFFGSCIIVLVELF